MSNPCELLLSRLEPVPFGLLSRGSSRAASPDSALSHYNEPIRRNASLLQGQSRNWGDLETGKQQQVVRSMVFAACTSGWNMKETAFLLAVAKTESGFNPDAASLSSSASGLGQFIDATGQALGIRPENRFDLKSNISGMLKLLRRCLDQGARRAEAQKAPRSPFAYAYALYHDGPSLRHGGLELAEERVLPEMQRFFQWLSASAPAVDEGKMKW